MATRTFTATVLGSGTSSGVPVIACDCPVCTSADPHNRRLRSSLWLRNGDTSILIDCGSDFREQALTHRMDRLDAILLTHAHSDHIGGLDEVRIFNWRQHKPMPVYGTSDTLQGIRRRFDYIFEPIQTGGGIPQVELETLDGGPFEVEGLRVIPLPVMHGKLPVLGFRFGDFAYVTDASVVPDETMELMRGVRFLILNALRHRPHPTHLTVEQAVALAQRIGPERAWFTHITHDLDHEATNRDMPPGMALAHDGLEFQVEAVTS